MKQFQQDCSKAVYSRANLKTSAFIKTIVASKEPEKPAQRALDHKGCMCVSNISPGRPSPLNNLSVQKGPPPRARGSSHQDTRRVTGFKVEDSLPNNLPTAEAKGLFHTFLHANSNSVQWSRKRKRKKDPIVSVSKIRLAVSHTLPFSLLSLHQQRGLLLCERHKGHLEQSHC